ncbi:methylated-DNA--[protein]-cysteine S-methyltransferase, partial [Candidatus Uhrbacteria bacterium]|nr:methylated-DNA--[protein]-cysteine S-methyltransferase [Candidatus Uhrbacteria bacterium]
MKVNIDNVKGTSFQKKVWVALLQIPKGKIITYTELAKRVGKPKAVRAVANAVAANPMAPMIPCHRVVRSDGGLGGYSGK